MQDYEKLGVFYLGKRYDLAARRATDELILYDSKDLTTHGVCVGMTGSGKTGLCVSLIEEAAIDGIPVIAIDPKGDLANLLLTFPELKASDFQPWIDPGDATRKGMELNAYARKTAETWKNGLAEWGQDGERIARLQQSADFAIYTPGSTAGLPITVLRSFDAPPPEVLNDTEAMQDRVQSAVSGLLGLLGIHADPLRSREHILLSNILSHAWAKGQDLDLPNLIRAIQTPPFDKVGIFDLESFFAAAARFELAMTINNLLASPSFATWLQGDPLDINTLLYTPQGRPRVAIMSISHLSDSERMFFVTILLNELLAWMRSQPGTPSLRAALYMDEIFGYFPPTAEPPSKKPMLTLLKQARAFGVGVLLATQNPVDLDYKGLSNTGTWFIGRLQTERDKLRVLDGLQGASAASGASFNRAQTETILSGLGSRVFMMNNVHDDEPVIFHARWAMSYLRGPMTRPQIEGLMAERKTRVIAPSPATTPLPGVTLPLPEPRAAAAPQKSERPLVPASIKEVFLPLTQAVGDMNRLVYRPAIMANATLHYVSAKAALDEWEKLALLAPAPEGDPRIEWDEAHSLPGSEPEIETEPESDAEFSELAATALNSRNYTQWKKDLTAYLYQNRWITLYKSKDLKIISAPGEEEGAFLGRMRHIGREKRDLEVEKIKKRYESKFASINDRIRRSEYQIEREKGQYKQQKVQTAISIGSTLLGAFFGRKVASAGSIGRATTAVRGVGRAGRERGDIARAETELEVQLQKLEDLEAEFQDTVNNVEASFDPEGLELEEIAIRPRKSDIIVHDIALTWGPWRVGPKGIAEPLF